jgi:Holliday junction resolvasome RuvABC endonuclease subunit
MTLMSVDPGLVSGYAVWTTAPHPTQVGIVRAPKQGDYYERAFQVTEDLLETMVLWGVKEVACEMPAFHQSAGGMVVARSGSLIKLSLLVGCLMGQVQAYGKKFNGVEVAKWKGQLSKQLVAHRVRHTLRGDERCAQWTDHEYDAVGIGLYVRGQL